MAFKNILDMHVHTDNSFDGNHSAMFMCEAAEKAGLRSVTFTDHCEVDFYKERHFDQSDFHSFFEVSKARSAFMGKLLVNTGIELGQPTYDKETAEYIMKRFNYDQVIGSIHNLRDMPDFCELQYDDYDIYKLLDEYFDEELELAEWGKFDTLAHLTYPLRYMVGDQGYEVDMNKFSDKVDAILKAVIKNGKALEINTSGYRQKIGRTMPDVDIVKRYKELGGELITLGSDSHFAEHVGAGIDRGMQLALDCGFNAIALFQQREPVLIPIE